MILKMNTGILPLVNPGLYGTYLGGYYEDVPIEEQNDFKELLCDKGKDIMNEILKEVILTVTLGQMEVDNVTFYSPQFYNFKNDEFDFDLKVPDDITKKIIDIVDNDFFKWIKETYCSRSGFVSYMPYEKEKYIEAIKGKDLERSIAMFIIYLTKCGSMCYELESYQQYLEDEMNDVCLVNGWYEHEDYEMED